MATNRSNASCLRLSVVPLAKLPSAQQKVLKLTFYEDLTQAQIAECTGWPLGTVKSHARRGLHLLHRRMRDEAFG